MIEAFSTELATSRDTLRLIVDKARRMPCGLDTESSGPQLRDTKKTKAGKVKYKDFINMWLSTTTGWSIAFPDQTSYYIPLTHRLGNAEYVPGVNALRAVLADCGAIYIHNLPHELFAFRKLGLDIGFQPNLFCTQILAWLTHHNVLQGTKVKHGLKLLAKKYLKYDMATFAETTGGCNFSELTPTEGLQYACDDAIAALLMAEKCLPVLKEWDLEAWYQETEMPCCWIVREMEDTGVSLDRPVAEDMYVRMKAIADKAQKELHYLCGVENPNSPKQLQAIFENGHWDKAHGVPTKTGFSFNDAARQKQKDMLPVGSTGYKIAEALDDFKAAHKLASTYTVSLLDVAGQYPDGRLHPSYHQTGTVTGRFSSSYPNGQNMPVRSEYGRQLLDMFRAESGLSWGSADFSQIELRILAHFAGGPLLAGYAEGADVHQRTADRLSLLLGTDVPRSHGKTLNFAKIYGAHDKKLASQLGCDVRTARKFRLTFEKENPHVMKLIARVHQAARTRGFVKTLGGRRRLFPRLRGADPSISRMGFKAVNMGLCTKNQLMDMWSDEREAMNTVCQGGAGDIMKKAMVMIWQQQGPMKFQAMIHDDARWETSLDTADDMATMVKETMEKAWPELKTPLVSDAVQGFTWRDLKG